MGIATFLNYFELSVVAEKYTHIEVVLFKDECNGLDDYII